MSKKHNLSHIDDLSLVHSNLISISFEYDLCSNRKYVFSWACGHITEQKLASVKKGTNCSLCANNIKRTSDVFYKLYEKLDNSRVILAVSGFTNKDRCVVQCSICENITETSVEKILQNQKCKCSLNYDSITTVSDDFFVSCNIVHNNRYFYFNDYKNNQSKIKIQCRKCGNIFYQRASAHLHQKQGCPICVNKSINECEIKDWLESYGIEFISEYTINGCRYNKRLLPYDFYIPHYNLLLEYHGVQHFEYVYYFHRNIKGFKKRLSVDEYKRNFAINNNYNILEIPYYIDVKDSLQYYFFA